MQQYGYGSAQHQQPPYPPTGGATPYPPVPPTNTPYPPPGGGSAYPPYPTSNTNSATPYPPAYPPTGTTGYTPYPPQGSSQPNRNDSNTGTITSEHIKVPQFILYIIQMS